LFSGFAGSDVVAVVLGRFGWCLVFDFGVVFRLDGGLWVLAIWMIVLDNSCGRLSFSFVESDEICPSILDDSSEWCWCRMYVRLDMQF
jgi:hypothetical protein